MLLDTDLKVSISTPAGGATHHLTRERNMKLRTNAVLGGFIAALMLSTLVTPASAARLSVSMAWNTRGWRATWSGLTVRSPFFTTTCPLTLEGSFHTNTFSKTRSALLGYVTEARGGSCAALLSISPLRGSLPWHLQYEAFTGTLPNIATARLKIIGFELLIRESSGITCLVRSTEASPLPLSLARGAGGVITSVTVTTTISSGPECFEEAFTFEGASNSFGTPPPPPQPSTTITLTLI
jgi:hypothetical protein